MRKKEFMISQKDKLVETTIDASRYGVTDEVAKKCTKTTMHIVLDMILNAYKLKVPDLDIPYKASYKGIAKCDKNDVFSERKGKEIAGSKADMKYHIAMMKKYKRLAGVFEKAQEEMYILEMNHALKAQNIKNNLNKFYAISKDMNNREEMISANN